jgi:hypothetical protein
VSLVLLLSWLALQGDSPTLSVRATKSDLTVGEPFTIEVTPSGPSGTIWSFPPEAGDDKVELRSAPASPRPGTPDAQHYQGAVYALGEVSVPPILVKYRLPDGTSGEVSTQPLSLHVVSLLPKDPKAQTLVDIRGPLGLSFGRPFFVALAALLVAGAAVGLLWRRRRKAKIQEVVPALPPDVRALEALDRLQSSPLLASGEYRAFYIALTEIAKRYLEGRLEAPVLEMTSSEMLAFLRDREATSDLVPALRAVAQQADQIKFARGSALLEEARKHLEGVREMIPILEARFKTREKVA